MIDLDHVAVATTDIGAALGTLVGELGGTVFSGGDGYGFRWVQTRLGEGAEGMTVELLTEWEPERNDFLARFLAKHGPGQHHLTFKVSNLAATLERVHTASYRPVGVDLRDPDWKEAFLQPREAHGTVVQLAEVHPDHPGTPELVAAAEAGAAFFEPEWWPKPPARAASRAAAAAGRDVDAVAAGSRRVLRGAARRRGGRRGRAFRRARLARLRTGPVGAERGRAAGIPPRRG